MANEVITPEIWTNFSSFMGYFLSGKFLC